MTMMGACMLWVGWYGFNAGSALAADEAAGGALMATHLSAAAAGLVWALIEWRRFGRASMVGLVTGVIAGLATVTPASGFVGPVGGVALGAAGSLICYQAVELVRYRFKLDDSLDVFAVHGVGGILGTLMVAILAAPELGGVGYADGVGMLDQILTQVIGVVSVVAWSGGAAFALAFLVEKTIGLRARDEAIEEGLDMAAHGERAYNP
jgi:Amt family ammonium transporter